AEAALEPVLLPERLLHGMQRVDAAERFDGFDARSVGLHRQAQAGSGGEAVEQHCAGSANAVLAADMGAGQAELVAETVAHQEARPAAAFIAHAVHVDRYCLCCHGVSSRTSFFSLSMAGASGRRR